MALIVRFRTVDPAWIHAFVEQLDGVVGSPAEHHPLRQETHRPAKAARLNLEVAVRTRGARGWVRWRDRLILRLQVA